MISGTSKISLNLGPMNGQIWTRGARIYCFYYTKILQTTLESIWEHPGTNNIFANAIINMFEKSNVCVPHFHVWFVFIDFIF